MSEKALNDLIVSRMGKAGSEASERAAELEKENVRLKEIARVPLWAYRRGWIKVT
jgi:hypothetical protein